MQAMLDSVRTDGQTRTVLPVVAAKCVVGEANMTDALVESMVDAARRTKNVLQSGRLVSAEPVCLAWRMGVLSAVLLSLGWGVDPRMPRFWDESG